MLALRITEFGKLGALQVDEVEMSSPSEHELLVRISAASVNPSDVKNVNGFMHQTRLPRTPGRDFAGIVEAGPAEMVGKSVWGTGGDLGFTRDGSHAEYLVIPTAAAVPLPANLSPQSAACCGVTFVTAAHGLREAVIAPGETVVVIGVFGGVGRAAAQIATGLGARVIGVARRAPPADLPDSMKTIDFINSSNEDVPAAVRRITKGRGGDLVYDTVGSAMLLEGLKLLATHGRIIEISAGRDPHVTINIRDFYHKRAKLIGIDSLALDAIKCASILRELSGGFETGELTPPPIAATYPLEEAIRAYQAVEIANGEGRHVLVLQGRGKPRPTSRGDGF